MKFNFIDCIEFEIDWKAVAAIAACVLGYAIITAIQQFRKENIHIDKSN